MASVSLSRESFNDAVEKDLKALKDSSIESLTKYQSNGSWEIIDISTSSICLQESWPPQ